MSLQHERVVELCNELRLGGVAAQWSEPQKLDRWFGADWTGHGQLSEDNPMARHRSFSSEFKRQISREFLEGRAGMHELARRYSLSRNLIRLWVRKYEAGEFTDELAEAVRIAEYEGKIAELERKVGQLTMEVDLLKKGARLGHASKDANYSIVSGPALSPSRKDAAS